MIIKEKISEAYYCDTNREVESLVNRYKLLEKEQKIRDLTITTYPNESATINVYFEYAATDPQPAPVLELCRGPKQLPPHIQATYNLELSCEDVSEIAKVMNNIEDYWPGMKLQQYGVAQKAGIPAYAAVELVNYEVIDDEKDSTSEAIIQAVAESLDVDPDELKEELGDIGVI